MTLLPTVGAGDVSGDPPFYPYKINYSLRHDSASNNSDLARFFGSQGNTRTYTFSFWIKRSMMCNISGLLQQVFGVGTSNNYGRMLFSNNNADEFEFKQNSSSGNFDVRTAQSFQDCNGWYHFVIAFDTTQGTDSKRIKIYVNGVLVTSFAESNYPGQNITSRINSGSQIHYIGRSSHGNFYYLDGYLADVNFVNGHGLAPESFGETKNGIWIPVDYSNKISEISRTDGTAIGDLTGQSGLSAAFDGILFKTYSNSAATSTNGATAYIGKDWGSGTTHTVTGFALSSNTDYGFVGSAASTFTVKLYGSNSTPSNSTNGTLLFTSSAVTDANNRGSIKYFKDTTINSEETISSFDTTTAYRYHWVTITPNTTESVHVSQVQFYEIGSIVDHGPNGFQLKFANTGQFGQDTSNAATLHGGAHTFTSTGHFNDQMLDTPTNNYSTWDIWFSGGQKTPSDASPADVTLREGNLRADVQTNDFVGNTFRPTSGKWYMEIRVKQIGSTNGEIDWGWLQANEYAGVTGHAGQANKWGAYYHAYSTDHIRLYDETSQLGSNINLTISVGDILQLAWDIDNGKGWIGIDNTWYRTNASDGNPSAGTNETFTFTGDEAQNLQCYIANGTGTDHYVANFGQDGSFAGGITAQNNSDANGQGNFRYSPPTGFLALCSSNLPDTTIAANQDSYATNYHNAILYTGNQTARSETGVGFAPDLVWIKSRNATWANAWFDTVRGVNRVINSDWEPQAATREERLLADSLTSFDADGFSLGGAATLDSRNQNNSGSTYVAWCWKAGGAPTATNSGGQNPTSGSVMIDGSASTAALASATKYPDKMSVNTTAGFSIVSYTGNSNSSCTIPHGLNTAPSMVIIKNRSTTANGQWVIGQDQNGFTGQMYFTNGAFSTNSGSFNNTAPSNTVVTVGTDNTVTEGTDDFIMYCFSNVEGYQKIGSYVGNGDKFDGRKVFTGFRPALVIVKATDSAVTWWLQDNRRLGYNGVGFGVGTSGRRRLLPTQYNQEINTHYLSLESNGFRWRDQGGGTNGAGTNYIYYAVADQTFKFANAL